jgi:RNA polymerase sigma factor (sigma-70 family)
MKSEMVDKTILKGSIKKNEKACKNLYEQSIPYVYSTVKRYIWDEESIMDVVQDIYINVFRNLEQFDSSRGDFKRRIRKIAINQSLMQIRNNEKSASVITLGSNERIEPFDEMHVDDLSREEIDNILSEMPKGYKTIFLLIVIDNFSHEEVSEMLNISKETSRSQLSRAKKWLQKYFVSDNNIKVDGIF